MHHHTQDMMLVFSVFTGGTGSRFGPSDSSHLWTRLNLSYFCHPCTILRLFVYPYSWPQQVAQGATFILLYAIHWSAVTKDTVLVNSGHLFSPCQVSTYTALLRTTRARQYHRNFLFQYLALHFIVHFKSLSPSYKTIMSPLIFPLDALWKEDCQLHFYRANISFLA